MQPHTLVAIAPHGSIVALLPLTCFSVWRSTLQKTDRVLPVKSPALSRLPCCSTEGSWAIDNKAEGRFLTADGYHPRDTPRCCQTLFPWIAIRGSGYSWPQVRTALLNANRRHSFRHLIFGLKEALLIAKLPVQEKEQV